MARMFFARIVGLASVASVASVASLWAALPVAAQGVYRCPGPDGQAIFQQAPCAGGQALAVREGNVMDSVASTSPGLLNSAERRRLIEGGRLFEGMSPGEVRQVLGLPHAVNRSAGRHGTREQWVYRYPDGSQRLVYIRDGALDSVSTYEPIHAPTRRERGDCPSELAIRNAGVGLASTALPPAERQRREAEVRRMRDCR